MKVLSGSRVITVKTDIESNKYHEIWSSILLMPGLPFFFAQSEDIFETTHLIFLTVIAAYGQPHAQILQKEVLSSCIYLISISKQSSCSQIFICSQKQ